MEGLAGENLLLIQVLELLFLEPQIPAPGPSTGNGMGVYEKGDAFRLLDWGLCVCSANLKV